MEDHLPSLEPDRGDLDARRDAMVAELHERIARADGRGPLGGTAPRRRPLSLSRLRLRTLVLPALAVFLLVHFSTGSGAPFGVVAAFQPGDGASYAGAVELTDGATATAGASVPVEPGDVVGTTAGSPGTLTLGKGSLALHAGARALVESLVPPRVRLVGGTGVARGRIRVVTANGVLDLGDGEAQLEIRSDGTRVEVRSGAGSLTTPDGVDELAAGDERVLR